MAHITPVHEFMHISSATLRCTFQIHQRYCFVCGRRARVDVFVQLNAYAHHSKWDGSLISGANFLKLICSPVAVISLFSYYLRY